MATGIQYRGQFDDKIYDFEGYDMEIAEDLSRFFLDIEAANWEKRWDYSPSNDKGLIELLPQIYDKFPGTILCADPFDGMDKPQRLVYPDGKERVLQKGEYVFTDPDARQSNKWISVVNTITHTWECMASDAATLTGIHAMSVPEAIKKYFLDRYYALKRIDTDTVFNPKTYEREIDGGKKVQAYHVALHQEAYGDRNVYAYIDDTGVVRETETYYSIGD